MRFYERMTVNDDFRSNITYIGILFKSILYLNFEGKLVPTYDSVKDEINYKMEKYFDLEEIMGILKQID